MLTLVGRLTEFPSNYKKGLKQTCEMGLSMTEMCAFYSYRKTVKEELNEVT